MTLGELLEVFHANHVEILSNGSEILGHIEGCALDLRYALTRRVLSAIVTDVDIILTAPSPNSMPEPMLQVVIDSGSVPCRGDADEDPCH